MGNLNLDLKSRQVFGEYLPSVYIGRTTIEEASAEEAEVTDTEMYEGDRALVITSKFSIYFTKDESIETIEDATEWINNNLDNLYLYTCQCPIETLNSKLENSQLNLKDLIFSVFQDDESMSTETFDSSHPAYETYISEAKEDYLSGTKSYTDSVGGIYGEGDGNAANLDIPGTTEYIEFWGSAGSAGPWVWAMSGTADSYVGLWLQNFASAVTEAHVYLRAHGQRWHKTPLTSLVDNLIEKNVYDSQGNEILQIAEIENQFTTNISTQSGQRFVRDVGKVFIIAFVGRDIAEIAEENHVLYNANFGDISYEHILENNVVPDAREVIFVEAEDGGPYNGKPIQTLNQKYYVPKPVSQKTIVNSLKSLLSNFTQYKDKDEDLKQNMNNLAYIIQTKDKDIDLIPRLQLFRKTYPDKSVVTKSGKMYQSFKKILFKYNRSVGLQTELKKQLVLNTKVMDLRIEALNNYYLIPTPSCDGDQISGQCKETPSWDLRPYVSMDEEYDEPCETIASDIYIPSQWSRMTREAMLTRPVPGLYSDFYEFFVEEGYAAAMDQDLSSRDTPGAYTGVLESAREQFKDSGEDLPYDRDDNNYLYGDTVVENKGMFFFDWEKALHTQSHIAHIFRLQRLQRLFRFTIPYKYFKVKKATLMRTESHFQTQNPGLFEAIPANVFWPAGLHGTTTIKIVCTMRHKDLEGIGSSGLSIPWPKKVEYYYDPDNLKFGQPFVYTLETGMLPADTDGVQNYTLMADLDSTTNRKYSYLKFKNFDVMGAPDADLGSYHRKGRLENYGLAPNSPDLNTTSGLRIKDSYRLMNFQYRDIMDDDVAFYNTIGQEATPAAHMWERPTTNYCVEIEVEDETLKIYDILYQKLLAEYNNFIEGYYEFAVSWCSYNNITERFNDFFKDAIYERYSDPSDWPWVRACYIFNLWRGLLFRSFDSGDEDSDLENNIKEDTLLWVDKMGPDNGTIGHLEMFAALFSKLVYRFKPDEEIRSHILEHDPDASIPELRLYERFLERAGLKDAYDSVDEPSRDFYSDAGDIETALIFANVLPIDQPIYGDLSLSAWWEADFEPTLEFEAHPGGTVEDSVVDCPAYELHRAAIEGMSSGNVYITAGSLTGGYSANEEIWIRWTDEGTAWQRLGTTPYVGNINPQSSSTGAPFSTIRATFQLRVGEDGADSEIYDKGDMSTDRETLLGVDIDPESYGTPAGISGKRWFNVRHRTDVWSYDFVTEVEILLCRSSTALD